jgi:hypothetical protein
MSDLPSDLRLPLVAARQDHLRSEATRHRHTPGVLPRLVGLCLIQVGRQIAGTMPTETAPVPQQLALR